VPYYTFAENVAASGGYWLLCAGDHVYANRSSIVGSIGVISAKFAAKSILDKNYIEQAVISTSDNLI